MDNRYIFRGIDSYSNQWVYGDLSTMGSVALIFSGIDVDHVVIPETIGQCTGLNDVSGKLIFEGDIVKYGDFEAIIKWADPIEGMSSDRWICDWGANDCYYRNELGFWHVGVEIIGTIHNKITLDKPENT